MRFIHQTLQAYEAYLLFTDAEAWLLFRIGAIAEAVGWTLLITGILLRDYVLHGNDISVQIAGRIHGTLFLIYLAASVVLYPSLGWSRLRAIVAIAASVPPYGSLLFEQWAAQHRARSLLKDYSSVMAYVLLLDPSGGKNDA